MRSLTPRSCHRGRLLTWSFLCLLQFEHSQEVRDLIMMRERCGLHSRSKVSQRRKFGYSAASPGLRVLLSWQLVGMHDGRLIVHHACQNSVCRQHGAQCRHHRNQCQFSTEPCVCCRLRSRLQRQTSTSPSSTTSAFYDTKCIAFASARCAGVWRRGSNTPTSCLIMSSERTAANRVPCSSCMSRVAW